VANLTIKNSLPDGIKKVNNVWKVDSKMKDHFVKEYVIPYLHSQVSKNSLTTKEELSKAREGFGKIEIDGKLKRMNRVSDYLYKWLKNPEYKGQPHLIDTASKLEQKALRRAASVGLSKLGLKQVNMLDEIDKIKSEYQKALSNPWTAKTAPKVLDRKMTKLFKENKRWLGQDYDPNKLDQYGWPDGKTREGYIKWQKEAYKESQRQSSAAAEKHGISFDAGHFLSLGGMKISKEEAQKYNIPIDDLEKTKDGYILRGTNAPSQLAIQIAQANRSQGKLSGRNIEDLLQMNAAFTKTHSLQEYLTSDDGSFRQNVDYDRQIRSLLGHNPDFDVNQLISQGEDRILNEGITKADESTVKQPRINTLRDTTQTLRGPEHKILQSVNNMPVPEGDSMYKSLNPTLPSTIAKGGLNILPGSSHVLAAGRTADAVIKGDLPRAAMEATGATGGVSTTIEPLNRRSEIKAIGRDIKLDSLYNKDMADIILGGFKS
jgi:hypothetical protein